MISGTFGDSYSQWLEFIHSASKNADLCAHFFRRADFLLGQHGTIGLIATNSIAQGDTRSSGLQRLQNGGSAIYDAIRTMPWPGEAAVAVAVVHLSKGHLSNLGGLRRRLDGGEVSAINSRLRPKPERPDPHALVENGGRSYQGSILVGPGFVLTPDERDELVRRNSRNTERIFPYIGGEEVNTSPTQGFERYVISFGDLSLDSAEKWPDLMSIVRAKVKPERDRVKRDAHRKFWWHHGDKRPALYAAIQDKKRCLVAAQITKHLCFSFQPIGPIFSQKLNIFPFEDCARFGLLQSRAHEFWARLLSSTLEDRLSYSVSECFDTFPFPAAETLAPTGDLEAIGARLYETRARLMVERNQGLTTTYNQLKDPACDDPEILALRRLHEDLDRAVLVAYRWSDIPVPPFETPTTPAARTAQESFEDEIIDRLFALNADRAEKERLRGAGARPTSKPRKSSKAHEGEAQLSFDSEPTGRRSKR